MGLFAIFKKRKLKKERIKESDKGKSANLSPKADDGRKPKK